MLSAATPRLRLVPKSLSMSDESAVDACALNLVESLRLMIRCRAYYHAGLYAERARVQSRKIHDRRVEDRARQLCDALDRLGCTADFALLSELEVGS